MSADQRDPFPSLQLGELRTFGVSSAFESSDMQRLRIERIDVRDVKVQTPLSLVSAASVALSNVTVRRRTVPQAGGPLDGLAELTVGELRLEGASVQQKITPLRVTRGPRKTWRLEPLASLDGTLHADIADAAWVFDADVTIPITRGRIDFNRATVEHIGPDSSMGLSRMGIYVDAPNGRTYLYLLSATHVPGANFERRGALLLSRITDRGSIDLQPFVECLLSGMSIGTLATGTRDMIARTRVSAEFRLGDGVIGDDQDRVVLAGSKQGKNRIVLSSERSGAGVELRMHELWAAESHAVGFGTVVSTGPLSATFSLKLQDFPAAPMVSASIAELTLHDIVCSVGRGARSAPSN